MKLPVSIIIPTFNEAKYLPKLLVSIKNQTVQPTEVIVVDAFSSDDTAKVVQDHEANLIQDEAWISGARNIGAKAATQPILLFLDSDVILPPLFLEKTITEMVDRNLDIASCFLKPISNRSIDKIMHGVTNYYLGLSKYFYPHAPGFCIFAKKSLHESINGFDEALVNAEDHDYVVRANKVGKFGYLRSYKIPVSVRRLAEEGRMKLALKYIAVEFHLIFLGRMHRNFFKYKFGEHYAD